jgi:hypothetical protein
MAVGTGTEPERAHETTLRALGGRLVATYAIDGQTAWINPVGVRHRERRAAGLQFCPACLQSDPRPYFRRMWRLSFATVCLKHGTQLRDRCGGCGSPVMPHRAHELITCWSCSRRLDRQESEPASHSASAFQSRCETALTRGWALLDEQDFQYSHLFFSTVRLVAKSLAVGSRCARMREALVELAGGDPSPFIFPTRRSQIETMSVTDRHRLFDLTERALRGWPAIFAGAAAEAGLWSAWALRDVSAPPFAFTKVVSAYLRRPFYEPSLDEVRAAYSFLQQSGNEAHAKQLKLLVGDSKIVDAFVQGPSSARVANGS